MTNGKFPVALALLGVPAIAAVWSLAARLVWEQTVWTWERGAQMVGFSLMHSGSGALLLLATIASLAWPISVLVTALVRRTLGGTAVISMLAVYGLGWGLLSVPYGFWQRLFAYKFSAAQATELMTYAAAEGDLATVRTFLDRGVPIDAQGSEGTALHAAAVGGQPDIIEYLLEHGADVNALNPYGDSPLTNASHAQSRSAETQALLKGHGGRLIEGTPEQRDRVIQQKVRESIERLDATK
jgi:hypothetical protein